MHYGMLIDLDRCVACSGCVIACKRENGTLADMYWCKADHNEIGTYPNAKFRPFPHACMHCENAPCVAQCPTGASYRDEDGGFVLINHEECIGCGICVEACPYGARTINQYDPAESSYWGEGNEQAPFEAIRTAGHVANTAEKCVFCHDRVLAGETPACVLTCVATARTFGDLDDPDSELNKFIKERNAQPYMPENGTAPSVYYVGL